MSNAQHPELVEDAANLTFNQGMARAMNPLPPKLARAIPSHSLATTFQPDYSQDRTTITITTTM